MPKPDSVDQFLIYLLGAARVHVWRNYQPQDSGGSSLQHGVSNQVNGCQHKQVILQVSAGSTIDNWYIKLMRLNFSLAVHVHTHYVLYNKKILKRRYI